MQSVQYAFLGLGIGAIYSLLALGLVTIYRGSGVLNFAQGALAMVGAYTFWQLHFQDGWSYALAFLTAILLAAVLGALIHIVVMRQLASASALMRVIATLGLLAVLEGVISLHYGANVISVVSSLPQTRIAFLGVNTSSDRLYLLGIAALITGVLYAVTRYTTFGIAMSATAENERAASALGWSVDVVATATWAAGSALAALAGILVVPITGLQPSLLTLLVLSAMAAALLGGFTSFPVTLLGGIVLGIIQSEVSGYVTQPGASDAIPLLAIIAILFIRGKGLPLRSYVSDKLPSIRMSSVAWWKPLALTVVLAICILTLFSDGLTSAVTLQLITAIILISVVIITGYVGQLSLAQYALAGMGAYFAATFVSSWRIPFLPAMILGMLCMIPVGIVIGLPALRTRGVSLAVVTLALGIAVQSLIFDNTSLTGGFSGQEVGAFHLWGLNLDPNQYPQRYAVFCLICLYGVGVAAMRLRDSMSGRRLLAVRENERAAASLGINVGGIKLYGFCVSAVIAGLGGMLFAFENQAVVYTNFDPLSSISAVGYTVIGGLGSVAGALVGSFFILGGVSSWILDRFAGLDAWIPIIGGLGLLLTIIMNPEGIVGAVTAKREAAQPREPDTQSVEDWRGHPGAGATMRRKGTGFGDAATHDLALVDEGDRERGSCLKVSDLTVRYGGSVAVDCVSFEVKPQSVVGLIGPNGAGKTSVIDAATGFVAYSGSVALGDTPLDGLSAHQRARQGLARTFQGLELFNDLTVLENIQVASERRLMRSYFTDLIGVGGSETLSESAQEAIETLGLQRHLIRRPTELPNGQRRMVGLARAIAQRPRALLLDEPAAGLDEYESAHLAEEISHLRDHFGLAVLLVEHDMSVVMTACDEIVVLNFGSVISHGTPEDTISDHGVIAAYLGDGIGPADAESVEALEKKALDRALSAESGSGLQP